MRPDQEEISTVPEAALKKSKKKFPGRAKAKKRKKCV
jgi:hypothetical protein